MRRCPVALELTAQCWGPKSARWQHCLGAASDSYLWCNAACMVTRANLEAEITGAEVQEDWFLCSVYDKACTYARPLIHKCL